MLDVGKKSRQYFVPPNSFSPNWRLKSDEEYSLETGTRPKESRFVLCYWQAIRNKDAFFIFSIKHFFLSPWSYDIVQFFANILWYSLNFRKYKFKRLQDLMLFNATDAVTDQDKFIEELDR